MTNTFNLVADVGATNARFGLVTAGDTQIQHLRVLPCANYHSLEDALLAYLAGFDKIDIHKACIAIAGATHLDAFQMANNHWLVNKAEVANTVGFEPLFINDFTAQAMAMVSMPARQLLTIKSGQAQAHGNRLVMGPGTGLGVAGLVYSQDRWTPIVGEGGHMGLAPSTQLETTILAHLQEDYEHVSLERVLCGQGLVNLYHILGRMKGLPTPLTNPADITQRGLNDTHADALASQTLDIFCQLLGQAAANAALLMGSVGGVYLSGGILPRMQHFLLASRFNERFTAKGRLSSYLESIPVYLCIDEQPGLLGASQALMQNRQR